MHIRTHPRLTILALALAGCSAEALPLGEAFSLSPESITFDDTLVGTTARERVTVTNRTFDALVVPIQRGPASSGSITVSEDSLELDAGASASFEVAFAPRFAEPAQARFDLGPDGLDARRLSVQGVGVAEPTCTIVATPDPLDFGEVVTRTRAYATLTLTNPCEEALNVELGASDEVEVCVPGGGTSTPFCFDAPATVRVSAGDSRSVDVRYTPFTEAGRERATALLRTCSSASCKVEVQLVSTVVETGLACAPAELDFGRVAVGTCAPWTVRCTNGGNDEVLIDGWGAESIGTPTSPDFVFEDDRFLALEPSGELTVRVEYCPSDFGRDVGHLGVRYRETTSQQKLIYLPLSGFSGRASLAATPEPLDFGLVSTIVPMERTLRIANVGQLAVEVSNISPVGPDAAAFQVLNGGSAFLAPGDQREVRVRFSPARVGGHTAAIRVETNDADVDTFDAPVVGQGVALPPCQYTVVTPELSFGRIDVGREQILGAQIMNTGVDDCLLTQAQLAPTTSETFELLDAPTTGVRIDARSSVVLRVRYRPSAFGTHQGTMNVELSSPSSPSATIDLVADAQAAPVVVSPRRIDFGHVDPNCSAADQTITIDNLGAASVQITNVTLQPGGAFTITPPALPATIAPMGTLTLPVGFASAQEGDFASALAIEVFSEGVMVRQTVPLFGRSRTTRTVQTLEPLASQKADVLFVVRNRPGTVNERALIGDLFAALTAFADSQGVDYQIGVTTMNTDEEGRLVHPGTQNLYSEDPSRKIITRNTQPSPGAVFDANLALSPGSIGSADRGMQSVYRGLIGPNVVTHNAGFLRPDASLSVVFLSDSNDMSPGTPELYSRFLLSTKEDPQRVHVTSIVAGETFCTGPSGSSGPAPRYVSIAELTGGGFTSICSSDWGQTINDIAPALFGYRTKYRLAAAVDAATLEVTINGMTIPGVTGTGATNWAFALATNTLAFSPLIAPTPGDAVTVSYATVCR
ncbi:MAG: choice-of-anchor D domain-containing protein [Deltaproteobacteria bacterium]